MTGVQLPALCCKAGQDQSQRASYCAWSQMAAVAKNAQGDDMDEAYDQLGYLVLGEWGQAQRWGQLAQWPGLAVRVPTRLPAAYHPCVQPAGLAYPLYPFCCWLEACTCHGRASACTAW